MKTQPKATIARLGKLLSAVCVTALAAVLACLFTSCGLIARLTDKSEEEYTFKDVDITIEISTDDPDLQDFKEYYPSTYAETMESTIRTSYRNAKIRVSSTELTVILSGVESKMEAEIDLLNQNKYNITGEYYDNMMKSFEEAYSSLGEVKVKNFEYYGLKNDDGFDLIEDATFEVKISSTKMTMKMYTSMHFE